MGPPVPPRKNQAPSSGDDDKPRTLLEASQRRLARHYEASNQERILQKLRNLQETMPRRSPDDAENAFTAAKREIPLAPTVMSEAAEAALHSGDAEWASREAVADLLTPDIVYNTMDGKSVQGKEVVIAKMNEGLVKMSARMRRSSSRGDGKHMKHLKMKSEGPTYGGNRTWIMKYTFEMMLMKFKIQEEFVLTEDGKVKELTRIRL